MFSASGYVTKHRRLDMDSVSHVSGIYAIVNKIDGKKYIGSSWNVGYRWGKHVSLLNKGKHHSRHLQNAWNKYGGENFDFVILATCPRVDLITREQEYLDSCNPEYNICFKAGSRFGVGHTEETKEKLRKANLGKKYSEETKAKHSAALKGRSMPKTAEWIANIVAGRVGWKQSEESKARISAAQKGKPLSEKNKQGISKAMKGNTNTLGKRWKWKKNNNEEK